MSTLTATQPLPAPVREISSRRHQTTTNNQLLLRAAFKQWIKQTTLSNCQVLYAS